MNHENLSKEFARQIYFCSGLGQKKQEELLANAWKTHMRWVCEDCDKSYTFGKGHVCNAKS